MLLVCIARAFIFYSIDAEGARLGWESWCEPDWGAVQAQWKRKRKRKRKHDEHGCCVSTRRQEQQEEERKEKCLLAWLLYR